MDRSPHNFRQHCSLDDPKARKLMPLEQGSDRIVRLLPHSYKRRSVRLRYSSTSIVSSAVETAALTTGKQAGPSTKLAHPVCPDKPCSPFVISAHLAIAACTRVSASPAQTMTALAPLDMYPIRDDLLAVFGDWGLVDADSIIPRRALSLPVLPQLTKCCETVRGQQKGPPVLFDWLTGVWLSHV